MAVAGLIFLFVAHYLSGRGLLHLFKIELKPLATFFLSMICGVILASLYPLFLELLHIPITKTSVGIIICLFTVLLNITTYKKYKFPSPKDLKINIEIYELPFLLFFIFLMALSAWRCFYFPPFARDMLSGPEAIAEYAVREHKLVNSIFSLNLESTNNHLKPPFVTDLQIIYKLFVYPFGEIWLSLITIPFVFWLYTLVKEKLHPLIACIVMLFFMSMPDPYAYTYIVLFDYCNMICYFAGFYFFVQYVSNKQYNYFLFSAFMFGLATYIRPETLVLVAMTGPLVLYYFIKDKMPTSKMIIRLAIFGVVPFLFYYIWMGIFMKFYMPVHFDVGSQIVFGQNSFWDRITAMTKLFIFGIADNPNQDGLNLRLYGYFYYVFLILFAVDLIFFRKKMNTESKIMLYGILVVYIGLPLLGYLIPWVDLLNTTKRGLYKMFPLMMIYFRNNGFLTLLSDTIRKWEFPKLPPQKIQPVIQQKKKGK